ncbi:AraC family transcriptional regulator [Mucilaginibacter sp. SP1R1]|uniref:AraC family transcriptional regulator n=1 Tax=Mucilaginibacter sp. SP1R1 TaxID=2723091 RepID=UPI001614A935|nr:helix-turn-helix domain-containing protein [Mucilaginibacter sp. SP1R1]MBB6150644.1 AraC-like DNA-binding protein [Mucilaginibacter sp. SP1R1]
MQLTPSLYLSNIVKHYLVLESDYDRELHYRLFSDGNPGMVFYFKTPLLQYVANHVDAHPRSFVYGQLTQYKNLMSAGKLGMLVVVLQPYGIYALSKIAACELNDNVANLKDLFGIGGGDLEDEVLNADDAKERINCIERFMLNRLAGLIYPDKILTGALKMITGHKGAIPVASLLEVLPVTERQLERKFKQFIGISPKRFSDTIRLQFFLKSLQKQSSGNNITHAVYEGGYYDQAHLNNYFKKSIGINPSQYRANSNHLAINFIQTSGLL